MLKIDGEGMIGYVIMHGTWSHVCKKCSLTLIITNLEWHKTCEKDVVGVVTFDLIGLLPTNHINILQWHVGVYEEMFDAKMKIAQNNAKYYSWNFIVGKASLPKKWQNPAIIQEISYSNLETGGYGLKSGVSQIIRERWRHCNGLKGREAQPDTL